MKKEIKPGTPCLVIGVEVPSAAENIGAQLTVTRQCPGCGRWEFKEANRPILVARDLMARFFGTPEKRYASSSAQAYYMIGTEIGCIGFQSKHLMPLVGDGEPEAIKEDAKLPEATHA